MVLEWNRDSIDEPTGPMVLQSLGTMVGRLAVAVKTAVEAEAEDVGQVAGDYTDTASVYCHKQTRVARVGTCYSSRFV